MIDRQMAHWMKVAVGTRGMQQKWNGRRTHAKRREKEEEEKALQSEEDKLSGRLPVWVEQCIMGLLALQ